MAPMALLLHIVRSRTLDVMLSKLLASHSLFRSHVDTASAFVRVGKDFDANDPFTTRDDLAGTSINRSMRRRAQREKLRPTRSTPSTNDKILKNWRVDEPASTDSSPLHAKRERVNIRTRIPDSVVIDKNNCQLFYGPEACLFVAK